MVVLLPVSIVLLALAVVWVGMQLRGIRDEMRKGSS